METELKSKLAEINVLVDEYRARCLWYLREDYYPMSHADALRVLDAIQRYGDADAFKKAGAAKQWLLQNSSEASAD
jgi:hypothetical protein